MLQQKLNNLFFVEKNWLLGFVLNMFYIAPLQSFCSGAFYLKLWM